MINTQKKHQRRMDKKLYFIDYPKKLKVKEMVYGENGGVQICLSKKQFDRHFNLHCSNRDRLKVIKNFNKINEED